MQIDLHDNTAFHAMRARRANVQAAVFVIARHSRSNNSVVSPLTERSPQRALRELSGDTDDWMPHFRGK